MGRGAWSYRREQKGRIARERDARRPARRDRAARAAAAEWWHRPFRIFQTNIREVDSGMDVDAVVDDIVGFGADVWLLNAGGIVSHYPSRLPHQHPSPWLKDHPSGDLIGDAVAEAHRRGVRVMARCDFSKVHRDVFEAHPDWCYLSPKGERQIYNGLYSACPSGPYYQEKSLEVINEILDNYAVDAFFFNMFSMALRDYSRTYHGICQCSNCRRHFAAFSGGMALPRPRPTTTPPTPSGGATPGRCWTTSPVACGR